MKRILATLILALPLTAWAGNEDDFGTWLEIGAEKKLPKNLSVGLNAEVRTTDASTAMDRWSIGASIGYKVHKYLKLNAGYSFLYDYSQKKISKEVYDDDELTSYRLTPAYWSARHRFSIDASSSIKLWKWLRISGKMKYQFSHKPSVTVDRYDYESNQMFTPGGVVTTWDEDYNPKKYDCESRQVLRSRVKLEVDKKHLDWSPFVSVEFHNNVAVGEHMNFDKLRTAVGTGYKINKNHDVSLSYVMTLDRRDTPNERMHAVCLGYNFDF